MDELVRWLGEQLDEDAAIAAEATQAATGRWTARETDWGGGMVVEDDCGALILPTTHTRGATQYPHIARHDPARVLREIDAKRQLLALYLEHERMDRETFEAEGERARSLVSLRAAYFDAVRHLAAVYADRPGYREEWRP
ncbi:DUF6221 family protein [Streptomyces sp. Inha503]|uniref:DUF6221 family protein n=1 Tax=Streptomyces sp. Inha503 TaxID=3383314 RepID=UPI0039A19C32